MDGEAPVPSSPSAAGSGELLDKGQVLVDVVWRAHHEGDPLVEGFGLDVQDPLGPGGGEAPGLLDQEGDGVALVEQAQLQRQEVQEDEDFYTKLSQPCNRRRSSRTLLNTRITDSSMFSS